MTNDEVVVIAYPAGMPSAADPAPGRRGRPPRISLEQIIDAGVEIGLNDLTLAAVANALDVHPAALYRYVDGRAELVQRVVDRIVSAADFPDDPTLDAEALLVDFGQRLRGLLFENPGLTAFSLVAGASAIDAKRAVMIDRLGRRGLDPSDALAAVDSVGIHVLESVHAVTTGSVSFDPIFVSDENKHPSLRTALADLDYDDEESWRHFGLRACVRGVLALLAEGERPRPR